ncbi:MAG: hypothetical protein Q8Q09_18855 [Deltaproteobacteria bacterium]|nr:hypothetical protein [Deltaproteobacteria bacterium]
MPFAPLVAPLAKPVQVDPDQCFALPETLGLDKARSLLLGRARDSWRRPGDLESAAFFEEPTLVHLPVWRVAVHAEGFHVGVSMVSIPSGRNRTVPLPIPTGGTESRDVVVLSSGRRLFASDPTPALVIPQERMVSLAHAELSGLRAEPDVPGEQAERDSIARVKSAMRPSNALYARAETTVKGRALVYVPLWWMRYRYDGEAVPGVGQEFFTAVDGTFGRVVGESHPSAFRAMVGKVKRLIAR